MTNVSLKLNSCNNYLSFIFGKLCAIDIFVVRMEHRPYFCRHNCVNESATLSSHNITTASNERKATYLVRIPLEKFVRTHMFLGHKSIQIHWKWIMALMCNVQCAYLTMLFIHFVFLNSCCYCCFCCFSLLLQLQLLLLLLLKLTLSKRLRFARLHWSGLMRDCLSAVLWRVCLCIFICVCLSANVQFIWSCRITIKPIIKCK